MQFGDLPMLEGLAKKTADLPDIGIVGQLESAL